MSQTSTKPYLVRALFDWCVDNGLTPHIVVSVDAATRVPMAFVRDGQIVLNIAPFATHQLSITNDDVTCQARFGGVAHSLFVPMANILAIYARENGQGMAFEPGEQLGAGVELRGTPVKAPAAGAAAKPTPAVTSASAATTTTPPDDGDKPSGPGGSRAGHLRVIK
ncbi:MAG: ClpXP protease specificity-enhancing factor [Rhodocyclaceae bacterium]